MPTFKTREAQTEFLEAYRRELESWTVPVEELDLPTDAGATHVVAFGNPHGKPLVLLHWFTSNSSTWKYMAPSLATDFRVYAIDTIGDMGKSIPSRPPLTEEDAARWLAQVLDGLKLEKPIVGGLSYGGYLAAVFTRLRPERVERLILMAPAATLQSFSPSFYLYGMWHSIALSVNPGHLEKFKLMGSAHPERWSTDFSRMFTLALRASRIQIKLKPRRFTDEELRSIVVPTLVLLGDKESIYSPSKAAERAKATIPHLTNIILSDCAHVIPIDAPEAAAQAIRSFAGG
jgi:pimeloyl-ACP methyl ester carboxylesterase